jgi:hypothetical protein
MDDSSSMNFQAYLENTYRIIKEEPIILILGGLLVQLLTVFSLGILAGPLMGGYYLLIICYLRDNQKPSFNDLFSGLQEFGKLFPFFLVMLLILAGFILLILPGLLFATWWLYVLPLMVDKRMDFREAMRVSRNRVNETGFLMHFVFLLLITVIPMMLLNFLSAMLPFLVVFKILLPPFQAGCLANLYIDQFGRAGSAVSTAAAESPPGIAGSSNLAPADAPVPGQQTENENGETEETGKETAVNEACDRTEGEAEPPPHGKGAADTDKD